MNIIHTGFSLGGYIAAACALNSELNFSTKAITLDSPGFLSNSGWLHDQNSRNIVNFVTVPNLVNTCHRHVGEIYQIISDIFNRNLSDVSIIRNIKDLNKELILTIQSHDLDVLLDILSKNAYEIKEVEKWPEAERNIDVRMLDKVLRDFNFNRTLNDFVQTMSQFVYDFNYERSNFITYKS